MSSPSNSLDSNHSSAQGWSYRVPSPPHITVPPASLYGTREKIRVRLDPHANFESNGFTNTDFLKTVKFDDMIMSNPIFSWKYESRRTAQSVLPFLYLGPVNAANDADFLQTNGITMVLAVRNTKSAQAKLLRSKTAAILGIENHTIDVAGNQELIAAFPEGIELINAHLSAMCPDKREQNTSGQFYADDHAKWATGKVLVYCETGNDRSALLVAAYIMAMFSMNLVNAIQVIQVQRFAVAYDDDSREVLQTYDSILQAKRDVVQANLNSEVQFSHDGASPGPNQDTSNGSTSKASKRTIGEADGEDIDMVDDGHDKILGGSASREGLAPFQDMSSIQKLIEKG